MRYLSAQHLGGSAYLKFHCGLRVIGSPVRVHLHGHFVVALSNVSLGRLLLDAEHLVEVGGLEELLTALQQAHSGRLIRTLKHL